MEIATGYFARAKSYADDGYALVSIALTDPWFLPTNIGLSHYILLSPTPDILKLRDKPDEYTYRYTTDVLQKLNPVDVYNALEKIASDEGKDKVVLMCYESPEKFCHRHIVAEWLAKGIGLEIKEVKIT